MNYFKDVPMGVICDYLTMNLIDELGLDIHFRSELDSLMFRAKVERALWNASGQTKDGKWNSEIVK